MFNKYSWDVVEAGCFVARKKAKGFVENGGGEFAYDHVLGRRRGSWNSVHPRERAVRVDTGSRGSGEREAVSIFFTIAITSAGLLVMSPVSGSRSADRCWVLGPCVLKVRSKADLRIDLSASLGFLMNIAKRAEP